MTLTAASLSSSVSNSKLETVDKRPPHLAMLLDIKKESDALQMEFGENEVGNLLLILICTL